MIVVILSKIHNCLFWLLFGACRAVTHVQSVDYKVMKDTANICRKSLHLGCYTAAVGVSLPQCSGLRRGDQDQMSFLCRQRTMLSGFTAPPVALRHF